MNKKKTTIQKGKSEKLTQTINPPTATNTTVTWDSNKKSVATVDNGNVTAVDVGTADIIVKTGDGNKTDKCTVTVTDAVKTVTIAGTPQVGQTLTANVTPATATVSYEWQKSDTESGSYSAISGATAKTYVLTEGESDKFIKVKVTGTGNYTGTQTSASTTAVVASGGGA